MDVKAFSLMKNLFIIMTLLCVPCVAQDLGRQLQDAYDDFDNQRVDSLLSMAGKNFSNLSARDQVVFHKFKAFRAFQEGEQQIVQSHFSELLSIDPSYTLDALSTSPKLLALFDKTKIDYLQRQQERLKRFSENKSLADSPWRSLLFPGWEQWHRGAKTKGYTWMALGTITLAGTIQAMVRTSFKHQAYLDETDVLQITKKYRQYNDLYQSQYYWAYSMVAVWLVSHVDAVFFTENKNIEIVMDSGGYQTLGIVIHIKL